MGHVREHKNCSIQSPNQPRLSVSSARNTLFIRIYRQASPCFALLCTLLFLTACDRQEPPKVQLQSGPAQPISSSAVLPNEVRIGMGAMITPKTGFSYYHQMELYIEAKLGKPVKLVDRSSYEEINRLLETDGVDIAFVCAGPYVEGHDKFGMELLAMPLVAGKPHYYSYIIVPKDSPARSLDDLRGKNFAFTDPKSNSGKLVPTYLLAQKKSTPETFFKSYVYTYGHDKSIKAVANHLVDGAAVDSLIWDYLNRTEPTLTADTKIIHKSFPCGIPPIVARPNLPAKLKKELEAIFLHMHEDERGTAILKGMMIDRFVEGDPRNYDSIRDMLTATRQTETLDISK